MKLNKNKSIKKTLNTIWHTGSTIRFWHKVKTWLDQMFWKIYQKLMFSGFLSSWNLCLISHLKQFLMTDLVTLYPRRLFTCVITFLVKRSINKVNSVIFGIKTDAGYSRHHNCHTKGNRSKKHDDMVGLRNFKNRKFIIVKKLIETVIWV